MYTGVILVHFFFLLLFQILTIVWLTTALMIIIGVELILTTELIVVLISQYQEVAPPLKLWTIKLKFCPLIHSDKIGSLFIWFCTPRQHCQPCNRGVNIQTDRTAWFSFFRCSRSGCSKPWQRAAIAVETFPQTFACGLAFEGSCLFLTFLVGLSWEHWIPSCGSALWAQTVWDDAKHFSVFHGRQTVIKPQRQDFIIHQKSTQKST